MATENQVSQAEFAKWYGVNPRMVRHWIESGMEGVVRTSGGRLSYIITGVADAWLKKTAVGKQAPDDDTRDAAHLYLVQQQGDKVELENQQTREGLVVQDHIDQMLMEVGALFFSGMKGVGARVCNEVALTEEPPLCKAIVDRETNRCRKTLFDGLGKLSEYFSELGEAEINSDANP